MADQKTRKDEKTDYRDHLKEQTHALLEEIDQLLHDLE